MTIQDTDTGAPRVVTFPSKEIRPVPAFTFALPAGWVIAEAPDALFLAGTPVDSTDRWANMLCRHSRESRPYSLEDAARDSWHLELSLSPDARILDEQVVWTQRRVIYIRAAGYPRNEEGLGIAQSQMIFFGPDAGHPTIDMFTLTCLSPESEMESFTTEMFDVANSFKFVDDPEPPVAAETDE